MTLEIHKEDLIKIIKSSYISYTDMKDDIISKMGRYVGGFIDDWKWNNDFSNISNEELVKVYLKLTNREVNLKII